MTPVIVLSDAFVANGAEPWRVPELAELERIPVHHPVPEEISGRFEPYARDELLARPWAIPGVPGLTHRIGGLEKEDGTGNISYDPENHARMVAVRARKVANAAGLYAPLAVDGPAEGEALILGWGGTAGACQEAARRLRERGRAVAHLQLRHLHPLPRDLGEVFGRYRRIIVPEMNGGQLAFLLRAHYRIAPVSLSKVRGRPFRADELAGAVEARLAEDKAA